MGKNNDFGNNYDSLWDLLGMREFTKALLGEVLLPTELRIVKMNFGLDEYAGNPHTIEEIAVKLGIQAERVKGIETEALRKVRKKMIYYTTALDVKRQQRERAFGDKLDI